MTTVMYDLPGFPDDQIRVANKFMADHGLPDYVRKVSDLQPQTAGSFLARGCATVFGNVLSSAHLSAVAKHIKGARKQSEVDAAEIAAWRKAHPDESKAIALDCYNTLVAECDSGELGMPSERGESAPRDPVEAEMRNLAVDTIRKVLEGKGLAAKRDFNKPVDGLELPDNNGGTFVPTMNQLIARQLSGDKAESYRTKATRIVAARNRAVEEEAAL